MHLAEVMRPEMFWSDLKSKTKSEVIRELADHIAAVETELVPMNIAEILMERERLGSTGIQDGIAIPHGKIPGLDHIVVACGSSTGGVDFDSHDGKPTHLFFVLLAPEFAAGQHLKVLARLSKLLKDDVIRTKLTEADSGADMYKLITDEDEKN